MKTASCSLNDRSIFAIRFIFTVCAIATVFFIFSNSAETGAVSSGRSAAVVNFLNTSAEKTGIEYQFTEYQVRKLAHFLEYMLLGFWLMLCLRVYAKKTLAYMSWPLLLGLLTAVADEFYQSFVPGRSGEVTDIVIDLCGTAAGMLAGLLLVLTVAAARSSRSRRGRRYALLK